MNRLEKIFSFLPRRGYTRKIGSLLHTFLFAIARQISLLEEDVEHTLADANILTSSGFWLDFWGFLFKITRYPEESDADYRKRIRQTLLMGNNTAKALKYAIKPFSTTEPTLLEEGSIQVNGSYTPTNPSKFITQLRFRPQSVGTNNFFVGKSFIGHNTYLLNPLIRRTAYVESIIKTVKMGGIKTVIKTK